MENGFDYFKRVHICDVTILKAFSIKTLEIKDVAGIQVIDTQH